MSVPRRRIAVVGAGAVGLSSALQVLTALPSAQVTIIAEKFNQQTTSDGAAGLFRPVKGTIPGVKEELVKQWMKDSFEFYHKVAQTPEAVEAGISFLTVYHLWIDKDPEEVEGHDDIAYDIRRCTEKELSMFKHADKTRLAYRYTTLITEGRWLLPWLLKQFKDKGGQVMKRKLQSLEELVGQYDVVVNCTGLGSAELLGDKNIAPNRGQVIRVKAPWIKHSLLVNDDIYIIPGKETVIVGGTRQQGDTELSVRASDRERIWEQACKYMPSLRGAQWQWEWVGQRPARNPLRLETETIQYKTGALQVVHNYGHSGEGVALSWGTGKHACRLVCDLLLGSQSASLAAKL